MNVPTRREDLVIVGASGFDTGGLQPRRAGRKGPGGAVGELPFATGLCLPSPSSLTAEDLGRIAGALMACLSEDRDGRQDE